eukprot:636283-Prorocentrum_minimum.AAC.5
MLLPGGFSVGPQHPWVRGGDAPCRTMWYVHGGVGGAGARIELDEGVVSTLEGLGVQRIQVRHRPPLPPHVPPLRTSALRPPSASLLNQSAPSATATVPPPFPLNAPLRIIYPSAADSGEREEPAARLHLHLVLPAADEAHERGGPLGAAERRPECARGRVAVPLPEAGAALLYVAAKGDEQRRHRRQQPLLAKALRGQQAAHASACAQHRCELAHPPAPSHRPAPAANGYTGGMPSGVLSAPRITCAPRP